MKFLIVCLVVILGLSLTRGQSDDSLNEWNEWKQQNNKEYANLRGLSGIATQEEIRYGFFKENLRKIQLHNARNLSYKLGLNEYSDLNEQELKSRFTTNIDIEKVKKNTKSANISSKASFARVAVDTVNWVTSGYVSPVQNQGSCGSCYAFSTAAALESAYAIKNNLRNAVPVFSAQQILDCSYYAYISNGVIGNLGCRGGYNYFALYYTYQYGIQSASTYPYTGSVRSCKYSSSKVIVKNTGIYTASYRMNDINAMKAIVAKQPLITYIYVMSDFYSYKSGIYNGPNCKSSTTSCPYGINHAVTIVGYGNDDGKAYWIAKNSWGTTWGENGYFKIAMGSNTCCFEGYTYYPGL